ncbi:MAG: hypothetical protein LBF93_00250 [Zoogloeaceae bacterium]|jgi:hypothetical protein|nr:hypothetical protein [Zoogloeaceae bacterium]
MDFIIFLDFIISGFSWRDRSQVWVRFKLMCHEQEGSEVRNQVSEKVTGASRRKVYALDCHGPSPLAMRHGIAIDGDPCDAPAIRQLYCLIPCFPARIIGE